MCKTLDKLAWTLDSKAWLGVTTCILLGLIKQPTFLVDVGQTVAKRCTPIMTMTWVGTYVGKGVLRSYYVRKLEMGNSQLPGGVECDGS